jgi:hypothetical protein
VEGGAVPRFWTRRVPSEMISRQLCFAVGLNLNSQRRRDVVRGIAPRVVADQYL